MSRKPRDMGHPRHLAGKHRGVALAGLILARCSAHRRLLDVTEPVSQMLVQVGTQSARHYHRVINDRGLMDKEFWDAFFFFDQPRDKFQPCRTPGRAAAVPRNFVTARSPSRHASAHTLKRWSGKTPRRDKGGATQALAIQELAFDRIRYNRFARSLSIYFLGRRD